MAAAIIPIASLVVPLIFQYLPGIIEMFHKAHPIPADASPAVKADLNALKAAGVNQVAGVLVNQVAAAGKIPVSASDPGVVAAVAGAVEQAYQTWKAAGHPPVGVAGGLPVKLVGTSTGYLFSGTITAVVDAG